MIPKNILFEFLGFSKKPKTSENEIELTQQQLETFLGSSQYKKLLDVLNKKIVEQVKEGWSAEEGEIDFAAYYKEPIRNMHIELLVDSKEIIIFTGKMIPDMATEKYPTQSSGHSSDVSATIKLTPSFGKIELNGING